MCQKIKFLTYYFPEGWLFYVGTAKTALWTEYFDNKKCFSTILQKIVNFCKTKSCVQHVQKVQLYWRGMQFLVGAPIYYLSEEMGKIKIKLKQNKTIENILLLLASAHQFCKKPINHFFTKICHMKVVFKNMFLIFDQIVYMYFLSRTVCSIYSTICINSSKKYYPLQKLLLVKKNH